MRVVRNNLQRWANMLKHNGGYVKHLSTFVVLIVVTIFLISSCGGGGGGDDVDEDGSTTPIHIFASWSGGAIGPPNDRRDEDSNLPGFRCPPTAINLINHRNPGLLQISHRCLDTGFIRMGICLTKGSFEQPPGGIRNSCATDPHLSSELDVILVGPVEEGELAGATTIASTQNLSINIFYCSDETFLFANPPICPR